MSEVKAVEILIIGNEILNGDIQDTNTNWLCKQISGLGGSVARSQLCVTLWRSLPLRSMPRWSVARE